VDYDGDKSFAFTNWYIHIHHDQRVLGSVFNDKGIFNRYRGPWGSR
jgi:hypothetical protein